MNAEKEKELNKKLAEWRFGIDGVEYGRGNDKSLVIYRRVKWINADEEWEIEVLEDLTQSLDACFRWLVPNRINYDKEEYQIEITQVTFSYENDWCELRYRWSEFEFSDHEVVEAEADSPALAFCLALEKAI